MAIAVARALAFGRDLEPEVLMANLAGSYDPARGYGRGTRRCFEAFLRGTPWDQCAFTSWSEGSAGNGAAARVAPVACRYWDDTATLVRAAALSSRVTHAHPDAIRGAVLQAVAVAVCLRSDPKRFSGVDFLCDVRSYDLGDWSATMLARIHSLLRDNAPPAVVAADLGAGVLAAQAVPAALWAFARAGPSFEASVLTAAGLGGDVDTICAMTGALAGALCGRSALPEQWVVNLRHERPGVDEIEGIALALTCGTSSGP
jgi:poly(ADP-ribose) glycohydrolase ARH3